MNTASPDGTIIHIGANKTGSTTLQRCLFSKSSQLNYLGEDCRGYETFQELLNSLVSDDDLYYDHDETRNLFYKFGLSNPDKTFVYSNEDVMSTRIPSLCAQRLFSLMPRARILVVLRNQETAIESWYANHGAYLKSVPRRYWLRFVPFDDWMEHCLLFIKYSPLDSYFYHRIVNMYAELFGKSRIHILLYEDFVTQFEKFADNLAAILNIPTQEAILRLRGQRERVRNTKRQWIYARFRSRFCCGATLEKIIPPASGLGREWGQKNLTCLFTVSCAENYSRVP